MSRLLTLLAAKSTPSLPSIPYSPEQTSDLALWLDASDASSIVADGSTRVSQWSDTRGSGFAGVQIHLAVSHFTMQQMIVWSL